MERQNEPLIHAPSEQTVITLGTTGRGSNKKAFMIAGLTVLACLLIAAQVMTAYFVLGQKNDMNTLVEDHKSLQRELSKGRAAAVPMKQHTPMNSMTMLSDDTDDEASTQLSKEAPFAALGNVMAMSDEDDD
ncbi:hypothetical protein UPYG_G00114830 [Umbra pygmaea]|uniref:MHC class II-associated invariant chain/CLIP MHC II-interacting domain-containing protein n=1 Tax=Umbra pygmaea TaxID=75934 RepID=A0ABD0XL16_UMBPY